MSRYVPPEGPEQQARQHRCPLLVVQYHSTTDAFLTGLLFSVPQVNIEVGWYHYLEG